MQRTHILKGKVFFFFYLLNLILRKRGEQEDRGVGNMQFISLHGHFRNTPSDTEGVCRTPAESREEYLTSGKEYIEARKTWEDKGTRGKHRSVSRMGPALSGWGNWSRGLIPTAGQLSESEEKYLRLRVKQLICGSLNGMKIRQPLPQPYIPWTRMLVTWKV